MSAKSRRTWQISLLAHAIEPQLVPRYASAAGHTEESLRPFTDTILANPRCFRAPVCSSMSARRSCGAARWPSFSLPWTASFCASRTVLPSLCAQPRRHIYRWRCGSERSRLCSIPDRQCRPCWTPRRSVAGWRCRLGPMAICAAAICAIRRNGAVRSPRMTAHWRMPW